MNALSIQGVSKYYSGHIALENVSFDIKQGEIFGLLGPNGAGKTSLIRIINLITRPDKGRVMFFDSLLDLENLRDIGYLPEERGLYKKMTVFDQLTYFAQLRDIKKSNIKELVLSWLDKFQMLDWKTKNVESLSKGMQQKIQFIAAVMHQPKLLILDEPFTGFDPINTRLLKDEMEQLKKNGTTIILSTHRMENVDEICDSVALINKSKLIITGKTSDVKEGLKQNFFTMTFSGKLASDYKNYIEEINIDKSLKTNKIDFTFKDNNLDITKILTSDTKLISFNENTPSMEDVFIQLTKNVEL